MSGSAWRRIAGLAALLVAFAAAAWFAWHSAYADHWRWRRAREAEHARAEALFRTIELPPGEGDPPTPGALVVAIGDQITLDESGWALAHDGAGASGFAGPWLHTWPLENGDLNVRFAGLEDELQAFVAREQVSVAERIVEVHASSATSFRPVRRVLQSAPGFRTRLRVAAGATITLEPEAQLPPYFPPEGTYPGWLVHLRADGMYLDMYVEMRKPRGAPLGVDVSRASGSLDLAALERFADSRPQVQDAPRSVGIYVDDGLPYLEALSVFRIFRDRDYVVFLVGGPPEPAIDQPNVAEPLGVRGGTKMGTPKVSGGLAVSAVEAVVDRSLPQLRYCYERELSRTPDLAGRLTMRFVVASDGSASDVKLRSSTLHHTGVETCVGGRFRRMQFPASGAESTVTLRLTFAPPPRRAAE